MSEADAIEAAARAIAAISVGISETPDHVLARAAYAAIAPIVRRDVAEEMAEYVRGDPKGCDVHGGERKRADDGARRKARTA